MTEIYIWKLQAPGFKPSGEIMTAGNRSNLNLRAFTLVEVLVSIVVVAVLAGLAISTLSSVVRDTRLKSEVAAVDGLIRKTVSECLARGLSGQVILNGGTITGSYLDDGGNTVQAYSHTLDWANFTRTSSAATPWLGITETNKASSFADNTLTITPTGLVDSSGVIFMSINDSEAAIEILANGTVDTFYYYGVDGEGEDVWTR